MNSLQTVAIIRNFIVFLLIWIGSDRCFSWIRIEGEVEGKIEGEIVVEINVIVVSLLMKIVPTKCSESMLRTKKIFRYDVCETIWYRHVERIERWNIVK